MSSSLSVPLARSGRCPGCHRRLLEGVRCPVDGAEVPSPLPVEPFLPAFPPGWSPKGELGAGGAGVVFAVRRSDGPEAALKVGTPSSRERFLREAQALRRLGPPVTPRLLDAGELDGRPYLLMERLHGEPLSAVLARQPGAGTLSLEGALTLTGAFAEAVAVAHAAGLVHRDLKPENLFVRREGTVALLDFGLVTSLEGAQTAALTQVGQRLGTAHYMAPELCTGRSEAGPPADVYALGVILYELLSGRPPFVGERSDVYEGHLTLRVPPLAVPRAVGAVLERALAKDPARRFPEAAALVRALEAARGAEGAAPLSRALRGAESEPRRLALLAVALRGSLPQLAQLAAGEGACVARQRGGQSVLAFFEHASVLEGARAALRVGRSLLASQRTNGVALELAEVRVWPGQQGVRLLSDALERMASAPPPAGWVVTEDARALLGSEALRARPEQRTPSSVAQAPVERPLRGREVELAALREDAAQAVHTERPTLTLTLGAPGVGKSRLWAALESCLPRVRRLTAPPPDAPEASQSAFEGALEAALEEEVVLIDDGQWLSSRSVDAVERATRSGQRRALFVGIAATQALLELRPHLGDRAELCRRLELGPLPSEAARALLLAELGSDEFVPQPVLARLEQLTRGNPLAIVELTRTLRESDTLRADPATGTWQLAAEELRADPVTPLFEGSARRALGLLPWSLKALAFLCATLGEEVDLPRLDAAVQRLGEGQEELRALDLEVGLQRLSRGGLLEQRPDGATAFRHPQLRKAVEKAAPASLARALHRAAYEALGGAGEPEAAHLAAWTHHAAGCGAHAEAARGYLRLAAAARVAHRDVEAERHYTSALSHLPMEAAREREATFEGRGRVRSRSQRYAEAREDLAAARQHARARGDVAAEVELRLLEATACDWSEDGAGCDEAVEAALALAAQVTLAPVRLRCALAEGRRHVRAGRWSEAVATLSAVVAAGEASGDGETELVARVLLGSALTYLGEEERSLRCFDEAISRSRARGDELHLGAALINRMLLWIRQQAADRAMEDLRQTIEVARSLGHAQLERWASYNTAELLHWAGRPEEARPIAERTHALGERFFSRAPVPTDALLLARIHVARGEAPAARALLAWISTRVASASITPIASVQQRFVALLSGEQSFDDGEAALWALVEEAEACATQDERMELLVEGARWAGRAGRAERASAWASKARALGGEAALWRERVQALPVAWQATDPGAS